MKSLVTIALLLLCSIADAQIRQYLVAGQSNARGRGLAALAPTIDTLTSFEFRPDSNSLVSLQDPVGVDFGGFQAAATGSPWPAFAKQYYDITSDTTVLIPAARGGSGVHLTSSAVGTNWSSIGLLYTLALFKTNQARAITNEELDGVIWLQGETDAGRITFGAINGDDYRDALIDLINRFRMDHGCHLPFYIILVGTNTEDDTLGYDEVRAAQEEVADIMPHTYIIHEDTQFFPDWGWMSDNVHYSQDGYNHVGEIGATNLTAIENEYYRITKSSDETICKGDSMLLSAPSSYQNYLWSNGDTSDSTYVTTGGRHTVTVTDQNGCSFPLKIDIPSYPEQARPVIDMVGNDTLCVGDVVTLNASPAISHLWSNGSTSSSITTNTSGDYFVQSLDFYGCLSDPSDTVSVIVTDIPAPTLALSSSTNICEGDTLTISAPLGFDTYQWSDGSISQSIQVTDSGTFTCIVGNSAGCVSPPSAPVDIEVHPIPVTGAILFVGATVFCEGDSTTLIASSQYDNYLWSTGDTTKSISVYESGSYSFSFINENGCIGETSQSIDITVHPSPPIPFINTMDNTEFCEGENITLNALSGFAAYLWSTGDTTQSIVVSESGVFSCFAIDSVGCSSPVSNAIMTTVNPMPDAPTVIANGATTFCEGDSVTLSAPSGFVGYQWSTGDSTQYVTVYNTNTFFNIVTDANGCVSPISEPVNVVVNPAPATPNITQIGNATLCEGDSLILMASPDFAHYEWSTGDTTQSIVVFDSGIFNYFAIDSSGCASPVSLSVETNAISSTPPMITASGTTTFCEGETLTLTAPFGFSDYQWSNGDTTQSIVISNSGTYTCIITSSEGCESPPSEPVEVIVLPLPSAPNITPTSTTTFCEGDSLLITAPFGYAHYQWSNGDTTQSITVYDSGMYNCFIINENNCKSPVSPSVEVTVHSITAPAIIANAPTTFCEGNSVTLSLPMTYDNYLWSNGAATPSITIYDSGTYDCLVTDANGCITSVAAPVEVNVISAAIPPMITLSGATDFCEGETVTLSAPSGFSGYLWSDGSTTQSITISSSGTYSCMITNDAGCESSPSEAIEIIVHPLPPVPDITPIGTTNFCEGDSLILNAPTGFSNYQWSTGDMTQSIIVYDSGIYNCFIINENNCTSPVSASVEVNVNPIAVPTITANNPTTFCEGDSVTLTASADYVAYQWSNGAITPSITVSNSGLYNCIVTADNGCMSEAIEPVQVVALSANSAPVITHNTPTTFCEGDSVVLSAPDGFSTYLWSNSATTQDITVSASGTFDCIVTNESGCISPPSAPVNVVVNSLPLMPVITASETSAFCEGDSIQLFAPVGFSDYQWSTGEITQSIIVYDAGMYDCIVINENGCESPASVPIQISTLAAPAAPQISLIGEATFCEGDSVTLTAPAGFSDYQWSNGSAAQSITVYDAGMYECFIINENGCTSANSAPVEIIVNALPAAPVITPNASTAFCEGDSVTLTAPAGFSAYQWSNGATTPSITVYDSGIYEFFIINESGCMSANSIPVEVTVYPPPARPSISLNRSSALCEGDSVTLTMPSGFKSYHWSTGDTTRSITLGYSGLFHCFAIDNNDCMSPVSESVEVVVNALPDIPVISTAGSTTFCPGENITLSAPSGFSAYQWSTGDTTQNIVVSDAGIFDVLVIDNNGCMSPLSNPVETSLDTLPDAPVITVTGSTVLCEGESVNLSVPSGYASYEWSNGETAAEIIVYDEGLYYCTITDANGCSAVTPEPVQVLVNPLPPVPVIQAIGAAAFCEGDSVELTVPGGYHSYTWSTGDSTQSIFAYDTGTYYCTVSDFAGCENVSAAFNTSMTEMLPIPEITYSGDVEFCEGESVTLFAPSGYLYQWSNGETTQDITISETSGPLACMIMDINGCMSEWSDTTFVVVSPQAAVPEIDTIGSTTLCLGESVELMAPAGFDSYLWNNGQTTPSITVGLEGTYTVAVANTDECLSEYALSVEVTVNPALPPPTISVLGSTNFCEGDNVMLSALSNEASGYLWSDGSTTQMITVSTSGAFSCIVLDDAGCQSQSSITVNTVVHPNPAPPVISILGDAVICEGDTTVLSASAGFEEYFWSNGAIDQAIDVTAAGAYSCYVVDENGCESLPSDTLVTEVRPLPPMPNIEPSGGLIFCEGESITLTADDDYLSYLWSTGETTQTITVNSSGNFYYTATDDISCRNPMSDTIFTDMTAVPMTPVITLVGQDTLCASEFADTYAWYRNDTLTTYSTQCIVPQLSGEWQVLTSIGDCMSGASAAYNFNATPPPPNDPAAMEIYPNPANGFLTMQTTNIFDDASFEIYDILGRLLYVEEFDLQDVPQFQYTIDIRRLPDAPYIAVLRTDGTWRFARKFIVKGIE